MLARLYDLACPLGETGRSTSSADIERNRAPTGLARTDLSWRTLLCAVPALPPLVAQPLGSDLLPAQGIGIIRRHHDAVYVSLDYGHPGGGHGHPDRLNLTLVDRTHRWFVDPGTGSYVDPSLHWYRSTLAHHAPLVDGHSQPAVHGELLAFDHDERVGWVSARAELAAGVTVSRSVVVLGDYLVDEVSWTSTAEHEITLPVHGVQPADGGATRAVSTPGGSGAVDGFAFLSQVERADGAVDGVRMRGVSREGAVLDGWVFAGGGATLWTAHAPAPPGCDGPVPIILVRERAARGRFVSVWSWGAGVAAVSRSSTGIVVTRCDGSRQAHARTEAGWTIAGLGGAEPRVLLPQLPIAPFDARDPAEFSTAPSLQVADGELHGLPAYLELGEAHYRRSESSWIEAGGPTATVAITRASPKSVVVEVHVHASKRLFVPILTDNPLDNEPASTNGDSVQLYAVASDRRTGLLLAIAEPASCSCQRGMRCRHARSMAGSMTWKCTLIGSRPHPGTTSSRSCASSRTPQVCRSRLSSTRRSLAASAAAGNWCSAAPRGNSSIFVETAATPRGCSASRSRMTDSRLAQLSVVLFEAQNPVNIAATVRAMKNMGVSSLRLVRPCLYDPVRLEGIAHDTWDIINGIQHFDDFDVAVADCVRLVGYTARRRAAKWRIMDPKEAAEDALGYVGEGRVGIVFGREDHGLPNEILDRLHAVVTIPTTDHASLNLAQAVLIALYELHLAAGDATRVLPGPRKDAPTPTTDLFERYFTELHNALDSIQFFKTRFPEHIMRSLRAITFRAAPDERELALLRAMSLEIVRFLERTGRVERSLPDDVSPRPPRHITGRDTSGH